MKHVSIISLLLVIALVLPACSYEATEDENCFYYLNPSVELEQAETVICATACSAEGSLTQLLEAYLEGPRDDSLISPFPDGTSLVHIAQEGESLSVILSDELAQITGIELTLACVCFAKTAISLTRVSHVEIRAESALLDGKSSVTINADALILEFDTMPKQGEIT